MAVVYKNKVAFQCASFAKRFRDHEATVLLEEAAKIIEELEERIDEMEDLAREIGEARDRDSD